MKPLLGRVGRLRLTGVALTLLPLLVLPGLGAWWLWQSGQLLTWVVVGGSAALLGLGLIQLARARDPRRATPPVTGPAEHWPAHAEACFEEIKAMASAVDVDRYSLGDSAGLLELAREVLAKVAQHFHPDSTTPLLEVTLPHTLAVIERTAAGLRRDISEQIPFSHQVRLGTLVRAKGWHDWYKRHEAWYRAGRLLVSPQSALVAEIRRLAGNQAFTHGAREVQAWMLREYIRKLGFQAIELYGGYARLDNEGLAGLVPETGKDLARADADRLEPLRVLVMGRANAGKSSLINALFGEQIAAADVLPDTTNDIISYRLTDDEGLDALIFDSPGFDGGLASDRILEQAATRADLILWVSAAHRADRSEERQRLDQLRQSLAGAHRRMPPLLLVLSHIDLLSPRREWQPPYIIDPPQGRKASQIVAAMEAAAQALAVDPGQIVPVCLHEERRYNVDDALWAMLLASLPDADRVRLLRCLRQRRREENWSMLLTQLGNAGRLLGRLRPGK